MKLRNILRLSAKQRLNALLLTTGVVLVTLGAYGLLQRYWAKHQPATSISKKIITASTDTPQEGPVDCDAYTVPAAQPRLITIPAIDVQACLQRLGINTAHNRLATPTNLHLAGWYVYSAVPGDEGVSIIDGHVTGRYGDGVFKNLSKLKTGDLIIITFGGGKTREFRVLSNDDYTVTETASQQYKKQPGVERQLTLVTCSGNFDKVERKYDKRTVVRAELLK